MSVADEKHIVLTARAAEQAGDLTAPRIFAAGPCLTAPGGHPVATILRGELGRFRNAAVEVGDAGEGRGTVRQLVDEDRVDLIKVVYSTIPGNVPRLDRDILDASSRRRTLSDDASSPTWPRRRRSACNQDPACVAGHPSRRTPTT
ncbi:MAG: hypothetical protein M3163_16260 [Actinomycetota bacterium]|nr:hypothetical protein [Actinomycetota bacterium]